MEQSEMSWYSLETILPFPNYAGTPPSTSTDI